MAQKIHIWHEKNEPLTVIFHLKNVTSTQMYLGQIEELFLGVGENGSLHVT